MELFLSPQTFFVFFTIFEKTSTDSFFYIFILITIKQQEEERKLLDGGRGKDGPKEETKKNYIIKSQCLYYSKIGTTKKN